MHKGAGLYIHIPFCSKKCAYCNFYSCVPSGELIKNYVSALTLELEKWGGRFDRPIDSVYLGGGTPSLLGDAVRPLLRAVRDNFNILSDAEITAEINPEADTGFLISALKSGVNRISMGVQSAIDEELKLLGRRHTADEAAKKVEELKALGFSNISLDLMLCLPDSNLKTLKKSLGFLTSMEPQHISAYMLKIEEKTALYKIDNLNLPDDDSSAEQYLYMCDYLKSKGYNHYEISNFCLDNFESRHNLKYWRLEEYLGIGPSAHSMVGGRRFYYPGDLRAFISSPQTVFEGEVEDGEEIMLGLRLKEGITLNGGQKLKDEISRLLKAGLVNFENNKLSLTDRGMLVSNTIICDLWEIIYENL